MIMVWCENNLTNLTKTRRWLLSEKFLVWFGIILKRMVELKSLHNFVFKFRLLIIDIGQVISLNEEIAYFIRMQYESRGKWFSIVKIYGHINLNGSSNTWSTENLLYWSCKVYLNFWEVASIMKRRHLE